MCVKVNTIAADSSILNNNLIPSSIMEVIYPWMENVSFDRTSDALARRELTSRAHKSACGRVADTPVLIAIYVSLQRSSVRHDKGPHRGRPLLR